MSLNDPRLPFPQTLRADAHTPRPFLPRTVLVVDDEPEVREIFGEYLRQVGHTVIEAECAAAAQRVAGQHPHIDVLMTDFTMPGMNGVELAKWFRETSPKTRIMIVTATAAEADAQAFHGLMVIEKPVPLWVLARAVEHLCDSEAA
jgi:CheY-like chemotaxis protein